VRADGTVGDVTVDRSLDKMYGLDEEAVKAIRMWSFAPGMKDGMAVAVRVHVQMKFTLK
jgi:TonB family protein